MKPGRTAPKAISNITFCCSLYFLIDISIIVLQRHAFPRNFLHPMKLDFVEMMVIDVITRNLHSNS